MYMTWRVFLCLMFYIVLVIRDKNTFFIEVATQHTITSDNKVLRKYHVLFVDTYFATLYNY